MKNVNIDLEKSLQAIFSRSNLIEETYLPCPVKSNQQKELDTYFPPVELAGEMALMTSLCG